MRTNDSERLRKNSGFIRRAEDSESKIAAFHPLRSITDQNMDRHTPSPDGSTIPQPHIRKIDEDESSKPLDCLLMEEFLETEMAEAVGAQKGERAQGRLSYRSGYYPRSLITRVGKLELRVPQHRNGRFSTEIFEHYQRSEKALVAALTQMYICGVSTRKVKAISEEALRTVLARARSVRSTRSWTRSWDASLGANSRASILCDPGLAERRGFSQRLQRYAPTSSRSRQCSPLGIPEEIMPERCCKLEFRLQPMVKRPSNWFAFLLPDKIGTHCDFLLGCVTRYWTNALRCKSIAKGIALKIVQIDDLEAYADQISFLRSMQNWARLNSDATLETVNVINARSECLNGPAKSLKRPAHP